MDWDSDCPHTPFFYTPIILFYREGNQIAVYERIGQLMVYWRRERVIDDGTRVRLVDLELLNPL